MRRLRAWLAVLCDAEVRRLRRENGQLRERLQALARGQSVVGRGPELRLRTCTVAPAVDAPECFRRLPTLVFGVTTKDGGPPAAELAWAGYASELRLDDEARRHFDVLEVR